MKIVPTHLCCCLVNMKIQMLYNIFLSNEIENIRLDYSEDFVDNAIIPKISRYGRSNT